MAERPDIHRGDGRIEHRRLVDDAEQRGLGQVVDGR